jgi:hypothetical protein
MKRIIALTCLFIGTYTATAQQPTPAPQTTDPTAPTLTLEEKIALTTDEIKKADLLEKAQKAYQEAVKPIQEHENAAREAMEKDRPGWALIQDQQGWHFIKKQEPKPAETPKK